MIYVTGGLRAVERYGDNMKMQKRNTLLMFILGVLLLSTILTGCGKVNESEFVPVEDNFRTFYQVFAQSMLKG